MLLVDMMAFAFEQLLRGARTTVIICANDGDYAHACTTLRRMGVRVVLWHGLREVTSNALLRACEATYAFRTVLERPAGNEPPMSSDPSITVHKDGKAKEGVDELTGNKAELVCPFLEAGKCSMGRRCKFQHSGDEASWKRITCALGRDGPHGRLCAAKGACIYFHPNAPPEEDSQSITSSSVLTELAEVSVTEVSKLYSVS